MRVPASANGEDVIQLFQRPLLRFRQEQEYQYQRDDVEARVETKGALRLQCDEHARECQG